MNRLFVYGSLQPGGPNHDQLAGYEGTWTPGWLKVRLERSGWGSALGYPGLVLGAEGERVEGQVFESEALADLWPELDRFEGDEYERVEVDVTLDDEVLVRAFVYVLSTSSVGSSARRELSP